MSPYVGCVLFSLPVFLIYLLGAARHLSNHEGNTCGMTYMFETPQYVRIQLQKDIQKRFPRYGLYAYGEGFTVSRIRAMRFSGIPVLFIPGNAGSHHQVRSLASVSLRKSLKKGVSFHFDFFTVDLHGEYSALYGGALVEQTEFVAHCIQRVLKFYTGTIDSVILIGHSMGGIVSKGVLLEPIMNTSQVNTIIMLATPHSPALVLDTTVATIYNKLQESEKLFKESEMITVSIGGGPSDVLVNSNQVVDRTADLNVLTTNIPGVWKATDHLCILWCKEFVLTVIRALFDSVDVAQRYPRVSSSKEYRLKVFNYHFLQRSAGQKIAQYHTKVKFEPGGEWIEDIRRQYTWNATNRLGATNKFHLYLMIRLIGRQDRLTIQTTNLDDQDWLFACSASAIEGNSRVCEWGWNLTNKSRIFPDVTHRKKVADLELDELKARRLTHVVVRVPSTSFNKGLSIGVDLHLKSDRTTYLKNKIWGFGQIGTVESSDGAIRREVNLDNNTDSVWLKLRNIECNRPKHRHSAAVELVEAWSSDEISQSAFFSHQDTKPKVLKVQSRKEANVPLKLKFTFDPECAYAFEVWHGGLTETLACTVRDRWPNLYGVIVGLLLLALAKEVDHEMGLFNSTITTTLTLALCFAIGIGQEALVALAFLHLLAALVCCAVIFLGSTVYSLANSFLARSLRFSSTWSEWVLEGLNQVPLLAATMLLSIVPMTSGALAMLLFVALQFLKLIKLYEDYLEHLLLSSLRFRFLDKFRETREKSSGGDRDLNHKPIRFHLVLFLVWCAAAVPAVPAVLEWAKNYRYSARLTTEDPLLMICWMILTVCGSGGVAWIPADTAGYYSRETATVFRFLGWTALAVTGLGYPSQCQYVMPVFLALAIGLLATRSIIRFST